ncbi:hypothetical protein IVB33_04365 [Bradyrhizobium sp. 24]|nr:hypothetical protein [Bradyrhizobium sp. 37]MCK1377643.1 hypothetical protein [Bradyrhizobium sp. 24]MCK1769113.1 hypothetical protein [Bradyrhizobium sp. 134]
MSPANVYRFFRSKGAINESICARMVDEVADLALAVARATAPAKEKLGQLLAAIRKREADTLASEFE